MLSSEHCKPQGVLAQGHSASNGDSLKACQILKPGLSLLGPLLKESPAIL